MIMTDKKFNFDAKDYILGRLASEIALILQGKNSPEFERNKLSGNVVTVINCNKIKVSGNKLKDKKYYSYSGYPGGLKEISLGKLLVKDSRLVIKKAVYGMLPKNKMRPKVMKKLILEK